MLFSKCKNASQEFILQFWILALLTSAITFPGIRQGRIRYRVWKLNLVYCMKLPAVMEKQSTKDETLVVRPLFYCCLYLKKNSFAFCEFFFKTLSDKAMPRCLCLLLMSFDCLFSSSTSPDYFTLLKKDGMSAVFLPLKKQSEAWQRQKKMQIASNRLPHLSIRYQSWHWHSWATDLLEKSRVMRWHLWQGHCHCLGVVLTCTNNGGRKSSKSDVRGKAKSGKLLEGDTS